MKMFMMLWMKLKIIWLRVLEMSVNDILKEVEIVGYTQCMTNLSNGK